MSWLHRQVLRALPKAHRERYGDEIARVFDEQRRVSRWRERPALWAREVHAIFSIATRSARPSSATAVGHESRWSGWGQDFEHATRSVLRAPGHSLTVTGCLAIGLAITLTAFSLGNTLFFGELPGIADRGTLSQVYVSQGGTGGTFNRSRFDHDTLEILLQHGPAIAAAGGQGNCDVAVRARGEMSSVEAAFVSAGFFEALGTRAALGRMLSAADERDAADVVVIGERFWRTHFDGSPAALGEVITVAGRDLRIVGVTPPGFVGMDPAGAIGGLDVPQLWFPLSLERGWPGSSGRTLFAMIVRHAAGVSRESVRADLAVAVARLRWQLAWPTVAPIGQPAENLELRLAGFFAAVLCGPLALLAIGCANAANLQLARSLDRTREFAVRASLGASRTRIMRLLVIEAMLLACGAIGAAWLGARVLLAYISTLLPIPIQTDWHVWIAGAGLVVFVVVACGVAPGWMLASRLDLGALKQTPQNGGRPHARLRHGLVGAQLAVSLMLLIVSGLMARTLLSIVGTVPEEARGVLVATVNLDQSGLDERETARVAQALASTLASDGRVQSVGLKVLTWDRPRYLRRDDDPDARQFANLSYVSAGYFEAAGMPMIAGRPLVAHDLGTPAVVVSQSLARAIERDGIPALGRRLRLQSSESRSGEPAPAAVPIEVVGIVRDPWRLPLPTLAQQVSSDIYLPLGETVPSTFIVTARSGNPAALIPTVRRALDTLEPRAARLEAGTLFDGLRKILGPLAYVAGFAGAIGALALMLATAGLYAVVGYVVSLRTREFGVRLAVGAAPRDITRLVVWQAARIVGTGAAAGVLITVPVAISLRKIFVGISPLDPWTFLPMIAALAAAAALASLVPARRAARIDPVVALRSE